MEFSFGSSEISKYAMATTTANSIVLEYSFLSYKKKKSPDAPFTKTVFTYFQK